MRRKLLVEMVAILTVIGVTLPVVATAVRVGFLSSVTGIYTESDMDVTAAQGRTEGREMGTSEGQDDGYQEGYAKGLNIGRERGYRIGFVRGRIEGRREGFPDGFDRGYEIGYDQGFEQSYCAGRSDLYGTIGGAIGPLVDRLEMSGEGDCF